MRNSPAAAAPRDFLSWWLQELSGLMPLQGAGRDPAAAQLVLALEPDGLRVAVAPTGKAGRVPTPAGTVPAPEMTAYLASIGGLLGASRTVGLRLPNSACFTRPTELPALARRDFAKLLGLDLERSTPFKRGDVLTAFEVDPTPTDKGMLKVKHLIVKRRPLEGVLSQIEAAGFNVTRIECLGADGMSPMPVTFEGPTETQAEEQPAQGPVRGLALAAVALACSALYLYVDRHESALQSLQANVDRLKVKAQAQRDALGKAQAAFAVVGNVGKLRAETVSKVAVLEELTRILPDTAWVSDVKIDGATVDISGLATSAASLVPLLERSRLFMDAMSTSSFTFDPRDDKERFAIRIRIRNAAAAGTNTATTEGDGR